MYDVLGAGFPAMQLVNAFAMQDIRSQMPRGQIERRTPHHADAITFPTPGLSRRSRQRSPSRWRRGVLLVGGGTER